MQGMFDGRRTRRSVMRTAGAVTLGMGLAGTGLVGAQAHDPDIAAVAYAGTGTTFGASTPLDADLFEVQESTVTGQGRVAHHVLPFGSGKPYVLTADPETGRYTERGAVVNFTGPTALWPEAGKWRAVVREEVQPAAAGAFGWSVTRVDVLARPGMEYAGSLLIVVWDDAAFTYPDGGAMDDVVDSLMAAGPANPGGR